MTAFQSEAKRHRDGRRVAGITGLVVSPDRPGASTLSALCEPRLPQSLRIMRQRPTMLHPVPTITVTARAPKAAMNPAAA